MSKLLSIIIPTKERYATLIPVINSLLQIDSDELEVLVQDNSNNNSQILAYLLANKDKRVKYLYEPAPLSQTGNSDLAVKNSSGEYICFIGDDDGVMPYIVEVVKWMKLNEITVLKSYLPSYYWPEMKSTYTSNNTSGILKYKRKFSYAIKKVDTSLALKAALSKGGTDLSDLPCLYQGVVKRSELDKIYSLCNSYFPGPSPDMANAIALSLVTDIYYYADFPLVISGKSIHSIGGKGVLHNHSEEIEKVRHLPPETSKQWSPEIPKYWTGPTIWAESILKALDKCGYENKKQALNLPYLYASLMLFNYRERQQIFGKFKNKVFSFAFFKSYVCLFFKRGKMFLINRIGGLGIMTKENIPNVLRASNILTKELVDQKLPFYKQNTAEM